MQLPVRTLSQYVQDMSVVLQANAARAVDVSIGSVVRALLEANAAIAVWLQWLVSQMLLASRAATSGGADLDSWMADFGLARLAATVAAGQVRFARYTPQSAALIPPGAQVGTADGSVQFEVVADVAHPAWDPDLGLYVLAAGQAEIVLPVQARAAGLGGNVQAGSIVTLASSIAGVDMVGNTHAMTGGLEAEADATFRARFRTYINSRSRSTRDAVAFAVASVRQGMFFAIHENIDAAGGTRPGHFVVTIDDGTGAPPSTLVDTVRLAVDAIRPVGSTFSVLPPHVVTADVELELDTDDLGLMQRQELRNAVSAAVARYVTGLDIGQVLSATRIAQVAYATSPDVLNVRNIRINGAAADLVPGARSRCAQASSE